MDAVRSLQELCQVLQDMVQVADRAVSFSRTAPPSRLNQGTSLPYLSTVETFVLSHDYSCRVCVRDALVQSNPLSTSPDTHPYRPTKGGSMPHRGWPSFGRRSPPTMAYFSTPVHKQAVLMLHRARE